MNVSELLKYFKGAKYPAVAAANFLDLSPNTIRVWEKKDGKVPEQWAALYREKANEVKK